MPKTKGAFRTDLEKYYRIELGISSPSLIKKAKLWFCHFGLHCGAVYRLGQFAGRLRKKSLIIAFPFILLYRLSEHFCRMVHHVNIGEATIGPGFYIGHVGTIYISPTTIGRNFSVTHNVTIGIGHVNGVKGSPSLIGDDVWVGTGSVISGPITIGNRVTISSGSILTRSVPDGCLVVGNPARVVMQNYDNNDLFGKAE